jgi:hypothetical protein
MRWPIPLSLSYGVVRRFHQAAGRTMVATSALMEELRSRGFKNIVLWSRGVDAGEVIRNRFVSQPLLFRNIHPNNHQFTQS